MHAQDWDRLNRLLADVAFFHHLWQENQSDTLKYWAKLESSSGHSKLQTYKDIIHGRRGVDDTAHISCVAILLSITANKREALQLFERIAQLNREKRDFEKLADTLNSLAATHAELGELDPAIEIFGTHETLCRDINYQSGLAMGLRGQGVIHYMKRNYDAAANATAASIAIYRQIGEKDNLCQVLRNQALMLARKGALDEGLVLLKEAEQICLELGDRVNLTFMLSTQAELCMAKGQYRDALKFFQDEEILSQEIGDPQRHYWSLMMQSEVLIKLERFMDALEKVNCTEEIANRLGSERLKFYTVSLRGIIRGKMNERENALHDLATAEKAFRTLGERQFLMDNLESQAEFLLLWGQKARAQLAASEAITIAEELGNKASLRTINELLSRIQSAEESTEDVH